MNSKKVLHLKKIKIANLDGIRGGNMPGTFPTGPGLPTADPNGCGNGTQGLACQYSASPMSCQVCVNIEK